jgi:hypothetical protein
VTTRYLARGNVRWAKGQASGVEEADEGRRIRRVEPGTNGRSASRESALP